MRPKTAGIIIIGNEILSGKVKDENSHFLATELRALGVDVRRVVVIPDEVDLIADIVREYCDAFDYIFTSGGVGPTHDDVTMDGIAQAFGVGVVPSPTLARIVKHWCESGREGPAMKMALIPEGSEVIDEGDLNFPPVRKENVYVFPGIPEYLVTKFNAIKERFRGAPFLLEKVYINEEECYIAAQIDRVVEEFSGVMIGSYPKINEDGYKVIVTLETSDAAELARARNRLIGLMPEGTVVSVDNS